MNSRVLLNSSGSGEWIPRLRTILKPYTASAVAALSFPVRELANLLAERGAGHAFGRCVTDQRLNLLRGLGQRRAGIRSVPTCQPRSHGRH